MPSIRDMAREAGRRLADGVARARDVSIDRASQSGSAASGAKLGALAGSSLGAVARLALELAAHRRARGGSADKKRKPTVAGSVARLVRDTLLGASAGGAAGYFAPDALLRLAKQAAAPTQSRATQAQKEAGNYRKPHRRVGGMEIAIENVAGSTRSGTSPDGTEWSNLMPHHYGHVLGAKGRDGDLLDIFVRVGLSGDVDKVHVVNQRKPDGTFDEHKCMVGWDSVDDARKAYLSAYDKGWKGCGPVVEAPLAAFKAWAMSGRAAEGEATRADFTGGEWVGVDLDGTLASYAGWKGAGDIGEPVPAMLKRVETALERGVDVRILTARVAPGRGASTARSAIDTWCRRHLGRTLPITHAKDRMMRELWDDRAVCVARNAGRIVGGPSDRLLDGVSKTAANRLTKEIARHMAAGDESTALGLADKGMPKGTSRSYGRLVGRGAEGFVYPALHRPADGPARPAVSKVFYGEHASYKPRLTPRSAPRTLPLAPALEDRLRTMAAHPDIFPEIFSRHNKGAILERLAEPRNMDGIEDLRRRLRPFAVSEEYRHYRFPHRFYTDYEMRDVPLYNNRNLMRRSATGELLVSDPQFGSTRRYIEEKGRSELLERGRGSRWAGRLLGLQAPVGLSSASSLRQAERIGTRQKIDPKLWFALLKKRLAEQPADVMKALVEGKGAAPTGKGARSAAMIKELAEFNLGNRQRLEAYQRSLRKSAPGMGAALRRMILKLVKR